MSSVASSRPRTATSPGCPVSLSTSGLSPCSAPCGTDHTDSGILPPSVPESRLGSIEKLVAPFPPRPSVPTCGLLLEAGPPTCTWPGHRIAPLGCSRCPDSHLEHFGTCSRSSRGPTTQSLAARQAPWTPARLPAELEHDESPSFSECLLPPTLSDESSPLA